MSRFLQEALYYAAASACALLVDMTILFVLVHFFSWWYLAAATVSFAAGVVVTYFMSVRVVFEHRRLAHRGVEFATFAAIGTVGLTLNAALMFIGVKYLGLNYLAAKGVAAGFTFLCNFLSRRQLLFVRRPLL